MGGELQIRTAVSADVPLLLELIQELAEYEKLRSDCVATEDLLRKNLFGDCPRAEALVAFYEGVPAGFALFFHNFSTFLAKPGLYLEDLFVRPVFRKRGIGRALLRELARIAVARDCGRLEWAVLDWNADAIAFYEKLGGACLDDWRIFRVTQERIPALASS